MSSSRRRSREFALQGIYQWQYTGGDAPGILKNLSEMEGFAEADRKFLTAQLAGTLAEVEGLRARLEPIADRKWEELSPVEKAILLLAAWELMHKPDIPYRVTINEAIELGKKFGGTDGHKYVNGVLDRLAAAVRAEEVAAPREPRKPRSTQSKHAKQESIRMSTLSSEFDLIARHFTRPAANAVLGVGDDAALIDVTNGMDLAVSTDTMVSGTHFFPDVDPENLGHKALAVNLSDMAAMGALPYWAMLALTLPSVDHEWLAAFAKGFFDLASDHNVSLIGGDTTRGPLTLTVTIMGEVPMGSALRRNGAKAGQDIWVSGNLGDAALSVAHRHGKLVLTETDYHEAVMRLYEPTPRVNLGQALRGLATSAIDISDGLLADLGHICRLSGVGATVELNAIPVSAIGARHATSEAGLTAIVAGGDDYELCFTAPPNARDSIAELTDVLGIPLTRIGQVKRGKGVSLMGGDGKAVKVDGRGFDHFSPS